MDQLPAQIVQEQEDFYDHKLSLQGHGAQTVNTGRVGSTEDGVFASYQCRYRVRKGSSRRCKNMCRATFPYCYHHTRSVLGLIVEDGMLKTDKKIEEGEVVCTLSSLGANYTVPNQTTVGKYVGMDTSRANVYEKTYPVERYSPQTGKLKMEQVICCVASRPINPGEVLYIKNI